MLYRLIGKIGILKIIPSRLFLPPRKIAHWLFGAIEKELLNDILNDTDLKFAKWAVLKLTTWNNIEVVKNELLRINGTNDKMVPNRSLSSVMIEGGGHFMIVDNASEISSIINTRLKKYYA